MTDKATPAPNPISQELLKQAKSAGLMLNFDHDSRPCAMGDSIDDVGGKCIGLQLERMARFDAKKLDAEKNVIDLDELRRKLGPKQTELFG